MGKGRFTGEIGDPARFFLRAYLGFLAKFSGSSQLEEEDEVAGLEGMNERLTLGLPYL